MKCKFLLNISQLKKILEIISLTMENFHAAYKRKRDYLNFLQIKGKKYKLCYNYKKKVNRLVQ
jgi:hypothetical protein